MSNRADFMNRHRTDRRPLAALPFIVVGVVLGCAPDADMNGTPEPVSGPASVAPSALTGAAQPAADWPNWRGPQRTAVAPTARMPHAWPSRWPAPRWQAKLGTGWSSPVVAEGRVYISDREGPRERLLALDAATGRVLWESSHAIDFDPHSVGRRHGNGPKSTPAVRDGRVYWLGIAGWLECLDTAEGTVDWQVNLPAQFGALEPLPAGRAEVIGTRHVLVPVGEGRGAPVPLFGYTGSLLLTERLVVLSVGGARGATVMAFDRLTGDVVWKALAENVAYSSPCRATLAGIDQVVVMTGPRVVGLDLASGRLLWSHPFQIQYDESISTPVIAGDLVLVTGDGHPLTALRIESDGRDGQRADVAWTNADLSSYLSSPLVTDGHVYGMNDGGQIVCAQLSDGRSLWTEGDHGFHASPVLADGWLLLLNDEGDLLAVRATPAEYRAEGPWSLCPTGAWTQPAVVGQRLYVRGDGQVTCFELGGP